MLNATLTAVEGRSGEHIRVNVEHAEAGHVIEATDLLIAAGRTPNTDGIGLELAGVEVDARGNIVVNERLETTAAGCVGRRRLRWKSAVHPRRLRRFPHRARQSGRRPSHNA